MTRPTLSPLFAPRGPPGFRWCPEAWKDGPRPAERIQGLVRRGTFEKLPALGSKTPGGCSAVTGGFAAVPSTRLPSQGSCTLRSGCSTPATSRTPSSRGRNSSASALLRSCAEGGRIAARAPPPPPQAADRTATAWIRGAALGAGSFGAVFKAFDPARPRIFAVKEVRLEGAGRDGDKQRERLGVELNICQTFRHPNIVGYLGHEYTETQLFIYLEYVPGGSVASLLSEFGAFQGGALRTAMSGMLRGLDYLHTRSPPVVHRDLKGANLLVDLNMCVKLADFGCSKWSCDTRSYTTLGSVPWMAPEVINQSEGYGRKADIWSFGCTAIEMATAEKPWGNGAFDNLMYALNHIANSRETPALPGDISPECRGLIEWCVRRAQDERPSTAEMMQHEFFRGDAGETRGHEAHRVGARRGGA